MKKKYFILLITLLFSIPLISQRNCGTMQYLQQQINENPSLLQKMHDNEVYLQNYILNSRERKASAIITIPVVVHVVY